MVSKMKKLDSASCLIIFLSVIWVVLAFLSLFQIFNHAILSKFIASLELIAQVLTIGLTINIYHNSRAVDRKIFFWLLIANISSFLNDLFFYRIIYVHQVSITNIPFWQFMSYFIPFIVWLASLTIFLAKILVPNIFSFKSFLKMFCLFFLLNLTVITLFFISAVHPTTDFTGVVLSLDFSCAYRLILFDLAMLCLICSKDLGMHFFLSGIIILASAAFLIDYSTIGNMSGALMYGELFWFLGILLMLFGIIFIKKRKSYNIRDCFRKINTIKSRLIFLTFGVSVGSFLVFFIISYMFSLISRI